MKTPLHETLTAVLDTVTGSEKHNGHVSVDEAFVKIPLEIRFVRENGKAAFYGSLPHTRWESGILPDIHFGEMHIGHSVNNEPEKG